jgi:hypothetical protein
MGTQQHLGPVLTGLLRADDWVLEHEIVVRQGQSSFASEGNSAAVLLIEEGIRCGTKKPPLNWHTCQQIRGVAEETFGRLAEAEGRETF